MTLKNSHTRNKIANKGKKRKTLRKKNEKGAMAFEIIDFLAGSPDSKYYGPDLANELGLPNSMGSFEELYKSMEEEYKTKRLQKRHIGEAMGMSEDEKQISFLNNYFVFKKTRNVNTKNVYNIEIAKTDPDELGDMKKSRETIRTIMAQKISKKVNKKFNKKFKLPDMGEEDVSIEAVAKE